MVGEGWFADSNAARVIVPTSVKEIQRSAFACCKRLKEVEFVEGSGLEKIDELCFYNNGLKSIIVPNLVREIPKAAF